MLRVGLMFITPHKFLLRQVETVRINCGVLIITEIEEQSPKLSFSLILEIRDRTLRGTHSLKSLLSQERAWLAARILPRSKTKHQGFMSI